MTVFIVNSGKTNHVLSMIISMVPAIYSTLLHSHGAHFPWSFGIRRLCILVFRFTYFVDGTCNLFPICHYSFNFSSWAPHCESTSPQSPLHLCSYAPLLLLALFSAAFIYASFTLQVSFSLPSSNPTNPYNPTLYPCPAP